MDMEKEVLLLNIDDILPNRFQPRIKFNDQALQELAASIKEHGVFQPIVVRRISDKYEIIAGERRYKASIIAGKKTIPAIVTSLDDKNSAEIALIENVQRQDLTPIEEAISYKKILDMGYISQSELGEKLGKNQSTIANKLRLLNLNEDVQEALMENKISERHARSLLKLNSDKQTFMLNRIVNERLTVRKTDEEIQKILENNENIEIKEQEGENKMNNDLLKEFNLPTEPIIEEENSGNNGEQKIIEPMNPFMNSNVSPISNQVENIVEPVPNIVPQPASIIEESPIIEPIQNSVTNFENSINPGFMDVDKIQSEAENIIKEPTPMADLDQLLKPTVEIEPVEPVTVQQPIVEEVVEPQPTGGKFFNMFNFNKEEENPDYVSDIESKEVNMDFGEPKTTTPNIFNFNTPTMDEIRNIEADMQAPQGSEPVKNVQNISESSNDIFNTSSVSNNPNTEIDLPINDNPFMNSMSSTSSNNNEGLIDFSKPLEPMSLNDEQEFTPISNFVETNSTINNESFSPIQNNPFIQPETKISPMMPKNVVFDEDGEIEVKIPQANEKMVTTDFKTVINTIRDCTATIEKYGYIIDTEEIDLADSYQVVFKIKKN